MGKDEIRKTPQCDRQFCTRPSTWMLPMGEATWFGCDEHKEEDEDCVNQPGTLEYGREWVRLV